MSHIIPSDFFCQALSAHSLTRSFYKPNDPPGRRLTPPAISNMEEVGQEKGRNHMNGDIDGRIRAITEERPCQTTGILPYSLAGTMAPGGMDEESLPTPC